MNSKGTSTAFSKANSPASLEQLIRRIEACYNLNNTTNDGNRQANRCGERDNAPRPSQMPQEHSLKDASSPVVQHDVTAKDDEPTKMAMSPRCQRGQRKYGNLPPQKSEAHHLSFAVDLLRIIDEESDEAEAEDGLCDQQSLHTCTRQLDLHAP